MNDALGHEGAREAAGAHVRGGAPDGADLGDGDSGVVAACCHEGWRQGSSSCS